MNNANAKPKPSEIAALLNMAEAKQNREYYTENISDIGMPCGGTGIVIPHEKDAPELDAIFDLPDPDDLPMSDEILPVIFDHALITEEGVIDCFARHYPKRAALLFQLLSDAGKLGAGYTWVYRQEMMSDEDITKIKADAQTYANSRARPGVKNDAIPKQPTHIDKKYGIQTDKNHIPDLDELDEKRAMRAYTLRKRLDEFGKWRIDDERKTIYVYGSINKNVDRNYLAEHVTDDDGINHFPTNKDGADWLYAVMGDWMARQGHPDADPEEEFLRNEVDRKVGGVALVAFGTIEMFGGVAVIIKSAGIATYPGVALTVVGFDTFTNGLDMLESPDPEAAARGWIGDGIHNTGKYFGGDELAQSFDRGWIFTQFAVSFGAPVVIRNSARIAKTVHKSNQIIKPITNGTLNKAKLALLEIKNWKIAKGLSMDYVVLPSGRGAIVTLKGIGKFVLPALESDIRVLLRLKTAKLDRLRASTKASSDGLVPGPGQNFDAIRVMLDDIGRHSGVEFRKCITKIGFDSQIKDAYFKILKDGSLGLGLPPSFKKKDYIDQLFTLAHELNHGRMLQKLVNRFGKKRAFEIWHAELKNQIKYVREEVVVELAAQKMVKSFVLKSVYEGKLSMKDVNRLIELLKESDIYVKEFKTKWQVLDELDRRMLETTDKTKLYIRNADQGFIDDLMEDFDKSYIPPKRPWD
ncbi:hypothetical protein [Parasulfitobacter algicola]|uniref:Uncharacterized protein n=1 Tax=Parasulfitobacter algicola TaxID=2614809 RepID=A0ABX2IYI9_9RHOB|nr:hypothetical protein [Sulfitobacter algicola]NSX56227.1 hypothetical protein [Sulfitobacter algicola]